MINAVSLHWGRRFGKYRNPVQIYKHHISFLLTLCECLIFYMNTIKSFSWVCEMSRNPESLNHLRIITEGRTPEHTHFLNNSPDPVLQFYFHGPLPTPPPKPSLYTQVLFPWIQSHVVYCLSTTYFKICNAKFVISGFWANSAKHTWRGRVGRRLSRNTPGLTPRRGEPSGSPSGQ